MSSRSKPSPVFTVAELEPLPFRYHIPDFRCFCGHITENAPAEIILSREESNHLIAANRARSGHPVIAFNGKGLEWNCTLSVADKKNAILKVESPIEVSSQDYKIALGQCIPKGKLIENIIRKSTEIGAHTVYPLMGERSEFRLKQDKRDTKESKWLHSAIEGAKQSGNPFLPAIPDPTNVFDFIETVIDQFELKLIACLRPNSTPLKLIISQQAQVPKSAVVLVGPEGDLTDREIEAALEAGFIPFTLGPYVLRCETAAVSCLSILRHELS